MSNPSPRHLALLWVVAVALAIPWSSNVPRAIAAEELRLAGPVSGLESLDPALSRDLSTSSVLRQIYRGLAGFDDGLRPVPELAESITPSDDGLSYDVVLRDEATFHDGTPIEAADVAFSLSRAVSPATAGGDVALLGGPTFLSAIVGFDDVLAGREEALSGISVLDAKRLRITLSAPQSTFVMRLASVPASIVDRDQVTSNGGWAVQPNGSGPFRVARFEPDSRLILDAFDTYPLGAPATDRVSFRLGADALQSLNLFQDDQIDIDVISPLDADAIAAQADSLGASLVETPSFSTTYVAFRIDQAPLDDIHVRRAIRLAFPSERVPTITLDGNAAVASGVVPEGMLGVDWPVETPAYDLDAARQELALSRYGDGEVIPPIRIDVSGSYAAEAFAEAVEGGLGIEVEIVDHDAPTFFDGLARGDYMAHELTWVADYPDPATFLTSLFGSASADNYIGFSDPELDRLLEAASGALDIDQRVELYASAQARIMDAAIVIPLFHSSQFTLVRDSVTGVSVTPMGILRLETITVQ